LEEAELLSIEKETVVGSAAFSRLGVAGKLTRIVRIVKKSIGF